MGLFGTKEKKKKRKDPSPTLRVKIILKQKSKCKKCDLEFSGKTGAIPSKIHHIDGDRSNKDESNLEALCPNCHAQKDEKLKSKKPKQG